MPNWLNVQKGPKLVGGYKIFFVFTFFPLFILGIISTMWFIETFLPSFYELIDRRYSSQMVRKGGDVALLVAIPAIILCVIWYKVVQAMQAAGQTDHANSDSSEKR